MNEETDILRRVGEALFGERWQTPLSRDLGVTDRTIRNWTAERHDRPDDLHARLLRILLARSKDLNLLISLLERETDGNT